MFKKIFNTIIGNSEPTISDKEIESENQILTDELIDTLTEELNMYYEEIFTSLGLPVPEDVPLVQSCTIITKDETDVGDPVTSIEYQTTEDDENIISFSNLGVSYNYPMALINPGCPALLIDAAELCRQHNVEIQSLLDLQMSGLKLEMDDNCYVRIDFSSCVGIVELEPEFSTAITAMQTVIVDNSLGIDPESVFIDYDKDITGSTILYIEHSSPLSEQQINELVDIARIELPEKERGMKIITREIDEDKVELYNIPEPE